MLYSPIQQPEVEHLIKGTNGIVDRSDLKLHSLRVRKMFFFLLRQRDFFSDKEITVTLTAIYAQDYIHKAKLSTFFSELSQKLECFSFSGLKD